MATSQTTIDGLLDLLAAAGPVTARRMFGEYCLYLAGKPVGLVCDDRLYVKPTAPGRAAVAAWPSAAQVTDEPPYPNAKPHLHIPPDLWDDRAALAELLRVTYDALPDPRPKGPKRTRR